MGAALGQEEACDRRAEPLPEDTVIVHPKSSAEEVTSGPHKGKHKLDCVLYLSARERAWLEARTGDPEFHATRREAVLSTRGGMTIRVLAAALERERFTAPELAAATGVDVRTVLQTMRRYPQFFRTVADYMGSMLPDIREVRAEARETLAAIVASAAPGVGPAGVGRPGAEV
jgi:hypothetical protein